MNTFINKNITSEIICHAIHTSVTASVVYIATNLKMDLEFEEQNTFKDLVRHAITLFKFNIVYVHCREEGCIGLYIPDDLKISLSPRDVPRASPSGHLSGLRKSLGRQGCTSHSLIIGREVLNLTLSILLALKGCMS